MTDKDAETTRQAAPGAKPTQPEPREDQRRQGRSDRRESIRLGGRRPGEA